MTKAAIAGGWERGSIPFEAVWRVSTEKKKKEVREEEDRIRAHMASIMYVVYLETLEIHFEEQGSVDEDRLKECQQRLLALSREVRLFKPSAESLERSRCLERTAAALAINN